MNNNIDYTYRAVRRNKTDIVFSVAAYVSAAVLYFPSVFVEGIRYVPILQFCALAAIVAGIYINQRYTWVSYVYAVKPKEDAVSEEVTGAYFIVYRIQGKRQVCLAKIDISDCMALYDCTHKDRKKNEIAAHGAAARYDFRRTMAPPTYCRAVFRADGTIAVIDFEPDETLRSILLSVISDNSTKASTSED